MNKDNPHSWVRICHGLIKLVTDLIDKEYVNNEQETSETKTEVFAFQADLRKAKPRIPQNACSTSRTGPILERIWIDFEPGAQSDQAYAGAKRINTLRHGELPRDEDGAIEFWRVKDDLQNQFEYSQYCSDDVWKSKMAGGGRNNEIFHYCTDMSGRDFFPASSSMSFRTQSN